MLRPPDRPERAVEPPDFQYSIRDASYRYGCALSQPTGSDSFNTLLEMPEKLPYVKVDFVSIFQYSIRDATE